jgi:hypothetical protein
MGRIQLLAVVVLSAWIAMTVCMWFAASGSFRTVTRVLQGSDAQFAEAAKPLSPDQARVVLRYLTSEINRTYFRAYGWAQLVFGVLLFVLMLRHSPRNTTDLAIAGAMLALAAVLTLYLTPEIVAIGRRIDFVPRDPAPPEMARFRMLHGAFTGLDGAKLLSSLIVLGRWILAR